MPGKVIIADFENEADYFRIKGNTAFQSLAVHRQAIAAAIAEIEQRGDVAEAVTCDLEGYTAFLERNGILNCTQNVAAYVLAKAQGAEYMPAEELKHLNIEVIREQE